jgi:hypothetical protein
MIGLMETTTTTTTATEAPFLDAEERRLMAATIAAAAAYDRPGVPFHGPEEIAYLTAVRCLDAYRAARS